MKKQQRQLIILLVILAIFAAVFFAVKQYNQTLENKVQEHDNPIVTLNAEDITKISYTYEGETYSLEKEGDIWYDATDHERNLTQSRITGLANALASLYATKVIENVTDMSQYGLTGEYRTISFETATESHIFYLGEQNTITNDYYICKPSESTVYTVELATVSKFNFTLDDMTEVEEENSEASEGEGSEEIIDGNLEETIE